MGQPAAKANDQVVGTDIHLVMVPAGPALVPTPLPHPFSGLLDGSLCSTVTIGGQAAATDDERRRPRLRGQPEVGVPGDQR